VTAGGSSIPEVQRLLAVLATGRSVAEAGTAFGEGAAAMAETARGVVTVELDADRAEVAAGRLEPFSNVELLVGDWRELLPPRGPFELVFVDGGRFKHNPGADDPLVVAMLEPGGLLVLDDLTPGRPGPDPVREWAFRHDELQAVEIMTTPETAALVLARRSVGRSGP
jgi:predicted O-methyltransferase YrrM